MPPSPSMRPESTGIHSRLRCLRQTEAATTTHSPLRTTTTTTAPMTSQTSPAQASVAWASRRTVPPVSGASPPRKSRSDGAAARHATSAGRASASASAPAPRSRVEIVSCSAPVSAPSPPTRWFLVFFVFSSAAIGRAHGARTRFPSRPSRGARRARFALVRGRSSHRRATPTRALCSFLPR